MLFNFQKRIKIAYNSNKSYMIQVIENTRTSTFQLQRHVNFETQTIFKGTLDECIDKFNKLVKAYNLIVKEELVL